MPVVLVHGNPETPIVWDRLRSALGRTDVVSLHLPGFGRPVGAGFTPTKEAYVNWLIEELDSIGGPIDLVGHDWGGLLALRVASIHQAPLRSWACDVAGIFDPDYVWHDFAQVWQTPGAGEDAVAAPIALPRAQFVDALMSGGIPRPEADAFAAAYDAEMGRCILGLYRSAAQPEMLQWGAAATALANVPGLVIAPADDPFAGGLTCARRSAVRFGAALEVLHGLGHWWMLQDPDRAALILTTFWDSVGKPER